jgi:hypothetical protein
MFPSHPGVWGIGPGEDTAIVIHQDEELKWFVPDLLVDGNDIN